MSSEKKGKGKHPKSLEALELTKWKKGQSGNPAGKPKGTLGLKERLAKYLEQEIQTEMPDGTIQKVAVIENILMAMLAKGKAGDMTAIKEILERYYGKEKEKVEYSETKEKTLEELQANEELNKSRERDY